MQMTSVNGPCLIFTIMILVLTILELVALLCIGGAIGEQCCYCCVQEQGGCSCYNWAPTIGAILLIVSCAAGFITIREYFCSKKL